MTSEITFFRDIREREIHVFTDAGRVCRPLMVVENNRLRFRREHYDILLETNSTSKVIELIYQSIASYIRVILG